MKFASATRCHSPLTCPGSAGAMAARGGSLTTPMSFLVTIRHLALRAAAFLACGSSVLAINIPASQRATATIPSIPGDGVPIKLYNGVGGGAAPTPASISALTPSGTTLSPSIDFPRPGTTITVGQSFTTFFANTTTPPDQVKNLAARNFILETTFYLPITAALDRNTATPEIDIRLGVGSDDGFYLVVGSTFAGSTGDRGFGTSSYDFTFEQPGLYPVQLLFAANSTGASGLEFYWQTGTAPALVVVPQASLYTSAVLGQQSVNFDTVAAGSVPADQYRAQGLVMAVTSGGLQITNAFPTDFIPVTAPNVLGCPQASPTAAQVLTMSFVTPGTSVPAITDFVEFYLIDADTAPGARIVATNQHGLVVYDQSIVTGGGAQQKISIAAPQILTVRLEMGGAGNDTSAIDNLAFNTPSAADLIPPTVAAVRLASTGVEIDFVEAVGLDSASLSQMQNFELVSSGGDKVIGDGQDGTVTLSSSTLLDSDTVRLNPSTPLTDEVYRFTIKTSPGVKDAAGNLLDGDGNGSAGGQYQQALTLDAQAASLTIDLQNGSDTGVANNDNITSQTQPTFDAITNEAGSITWKIDNGSPTTRLVGAGATAFPVTAPLADGVHQAIGSFDAATPTGSPLQQTLAFTIDTTAPVAGAVSFNGSPIANGAIIRQSGTLSAAVTDAGGLSRVEFHVRPAGGSDVLIATDTTPGNGISATWDAGALADGAYVISIRAYDKVNLSVETTREVTKAPPLPVLALSLDPSTVAEGGTVAGTVSMDKLWPDPIVVALGVTASGRLSFPSSVTIPVGQTSVPFSVQAFQNSSIEPTVQLSMIASSPGLTAVTRPLQITDDDMPNVQFTLDREIVGEDEGPTALRGTLRLSRAVTVNLTASLSASPAGQVSLPATVFIPAGTLTVPVPIAVLDNDIVNGNRSVIISGHVNLSGGAQLATLANAAFTITDDENPSLSFAFTGDLLVEGRSPATTATVFLQPLSATPVVVTLAASDPARVSMPLEITIPAQQASASFDIGAVNDGVAGGTRSLAFTATASGYNPASAALTLTDEARPDLTVETLSTPSGAETDAWVNLGWRLRNQGSAAAPAPFTQRIYLSPDETVGSDSVLTQVVFSDSLPANSAIEQTIPVRLPSAPGRYWIIVQADAGTEVPEVIEENNHGIAAQSIDIEAAYSTTLSIAPATVPTNTAIPITGTATLRTGGTAKFALVNIHITHRGVQRIISALTNSVGAFSTTFTPLPGEGGRMQFGAAHPGVTTAAVQDEVRVYGLQADPATLALSVAESSTKQGTLLIRNLADLPITGLAANVSGVPAGVQFSATPASSTLASEGTVVLDYSVTTQGALPVSPFTISLSSNEGAALSIPVTLTVVANVPRLAVEPVRLEAGMLRGQQQIVDFTLRNDGKAPSGPVNVLLPSGVPWMQLVTPLPLPAIPPSGSIPVSLQLTPPADLALGDHTGTLVATDGTTSVNIPFKFRALSDQMGQLLVRVEDEYTYYATGNPPLAGATVRVTDAVSGELIGTQTTGVSGTVDFGALREGYYRIEVTAAKHSSYRSDYLVQPGRTNTAAVFISRQTVSYSWTVVPTQVEDHYKITIDTTFETNVPVPVVTMEPSVIDLTDFQGTEMVVPIKVTNHGLIAANNTQLTVPSHPDWTFTPLISTIGVLPAGSSITVPMTVRRVAAPPPPPGEAEGGNEAGGGGAGGALGAAPPPAGPCTVVISGCWDLICGTLHNRYCATITIHAADGCGAPGPDPGGRCNGCGSGPGEGGSYNPPGDGQTVSSCDPCGLKRLLAAMSCAVKFIPALLPEDVREIYKCLNATAGCAGKLNEGILTRQSAYKCTKAGLTCARAAGKVVKWLKFVECACEMLTACRGIPGHNPSGLESAAATVCDFTGMTGEAPPPGLADAPPPSFESTPELVPLFNQTQRMRAAANYQAYLLGSYDWMRMSDDTEADLAAALLAAYEEAIEESSPSGAHISAAEESALLALPRPPVITAGIISAMTQRWNRSMDYWDAGIFNRADVPQGSSTDFIAVDTLSALGAAAEVALDASEAAGYDSLDNGLAQEMQTLRTHYLSQPSGEGVCARVKLRLEQDAVITRDAFRATLELVNSGATALSNVRVDVSIRPRSGGVADELFSVRLEGVTALSAVNGTGSLAANTTGTANWLILPTQDAAPDVPTEYLVGGTLSYRVDGVDVTLPLYEASITVLPCPLLTLKYFHQRDVFSDDPFTPQVEPSIPYTLGVMVQNHGAGTARNMRITSAQPSIIENEKGLLADFRIIATQVAGQPLQPSLTANFGDITPGQIKIGEWLMTSTLQGLFIDYKATFQHVDELNDRRLSLIDSVEIHEMIHPLRALGALEDGKPDYFVNDVPDLRDLGDTIHLSDGSTAPVALVESGAASGQLTKTLTSTLPAGWAYLRIPDPSGGQQRLTRVTRSDGLEIPLDVNVWVTDRTFIGQGLRPVSESILHLVDRDSTGAYTLYYEEWSAADTQPPTSQVLALPGQSATHFPVHWQGTDNRGVAFYDISVSTNGGAFVPWIERSSATGAVFQGSTGQSYAFKSRATDAAGNAEPDHAAADASTSVTLVNQAPVLASIPDQEIAEGSTLALQLSASDPDGSADLLTYAFTGAVPPGLTLNAASGQLLWATSESDGGREVPVQVTVTDAGSPAASATRAFTIRVIDFNSPPTLGAVGPQHLEPGETLSLTVSALDADLPAQTLAYQFDSTPPGGMTLHAQTGALTWPTVPADAGRTILVSVIVTDNGLPARSATLSFPVTVGALPPSAARESWRETHFGSSENSGSAADTFDFDRDGLKNLIEFAFGLDPKQSASFQLPQGHVEGEHFVIRFTQPSEVNGVIYGAEWSTTLSTNPEDWTEIPDTGVSREHIFAVPMNGNEKIFVRMIVTTQE